MSSVPHIETPSTTLAGNLALAKLVGYLTIIDLLFLPYLQLVIIPYSLPLILLAIVVLDTRVKVDNYVVLFGVISAAVLLSVGASFAVSANDNLLDNFKRLVQLLTSFLYFFYFRWLASRTEIPLTRVCAYFLVWFGLLEVAFLLKPELTGDFLRIVYGRLVTSEDTLAEHLRFGYLFTDPNAAAYFLLMAASPLLVTRRSLPALAFVTFVVGGLTFVTQSRGALAVLVLMVMAILYPPKKFLPSLMSARRATAVLAAILALVAVVVTLRIFAQDTTDFIKMAYERIFETGDVATGGSRFEIWQKLSSYYMALPLGRGYVLIIDGVAQRPHSDLIRFIYSYGLLAAIPMVWFLFSRILSFAPLILPALAAFMINTLIDDQKLIALFLALLAICIGSEERQAREAQNR